MPNPKSTRWCFTLNNYTDDHVSKLAAIECKYLIYGKEVSPTTGTPHLQGFIIFENARYRNSIRLEVGGGHWERCVGTSQQAAEYCRKDGEIFERGDLPSNPGKRTDVDNHIQWLDEFIAEHGRAPSDQECARLRPVLLLRFRNFVEVARLRAPSPVLREGEPRYWQQQLDNELSDPPDDRSVIFYVDEDGGTGKSWFQQWYLTKHEDVVQCIGVGKRDDMAHSIDPTKSVFFINVPRGGMEYLQYTILEQLKDRMVYSPKYNSAMKVLTRVPHVVVFCNEMPDMTKMSEDRYIIRNEY